MRYTPRRPRYFGGFTLAVVAVIAATIFLAESSPLAYASVSAVAPATTTAARVASHSGPTVTPAAVAKAAAVKAAAKKKAAAVAAAKKKAAALAAAKRKAAISPYKVGTKKYNLWYARTYMKAKYKWDFAQFVCLTKTWGRESAWNQFAYNRSGAQGIPQAMPGKKMAKFGKDWRTNPVTQIRWGLNYIKHAYRSPCGAWNFWQYHHWY